MLTPFNFNPEGKRNSFFDILAKGSKIIFLSVDLVPSFVGIKSLLLRSASTMGFYTVSQQQLEGGKFSIAQGSLL